uniref:Tick transposon n=1 Tax=Brugia timori TaxID=42155 RepID=A0A0R3QRM1_9BILA
LLNFYHGEIICWKFVVIHFFNNLFNIVRDPGKKSQRIRIHQHIARGCEQAGKKSQIPESDECSCIYINYSAHDFHESCARIDATLHSNVSVRDHGDITVVIDYHDPFPLLLAVRSSKTSNG